MTYCLGIKINKGLLFMSDTRTNAGVDNISTFKKIFTFNYREKVYITILASGNLATTQFLINSLNDIFEEKNNEKSHQFNLFKAYFLKPEHYKIHRSGFKNYAQIVDVVFSL